MNEGNRKNKNVSSSPKRTRYVNPSGLNSTPSGSRHTRLFPPPSTSVLDREVFTQELDLFEISPKTNTRSFPYSVKQQCWEKAEKVKGRDPDRWRRDPLGNTVFRKLVGCPGCLCHDYDHIIPYSKVQIVSGKMQYRWKDHLKVVLFKIGNTHTLVMKLGAGLIDASFCLSGLLASTKLLRVEKVH